MPARWVWFVWAISLLLPWWWIHQRRPALRRPLWWSSLVALPLGLTEPLFIGRYWNPPTLFDLARRTGFDLESLIFAFAVGGLAGVLYDVAVGGERPASATSHALAVGHRSHPSPTALQWTLIAPGLVTTALLFGTGRPLLAGVVGLTVGGGLRIVFLPGLRARTLVGAGLFAAGYVAVLAALAVLVPDYAAHLWLDAGPRFRYIPLAEAAFALSFGFFWSGLYDQVALLTAPEKRAATTPHDRAERRADGGSLPG